MNKPHVFWGVRSPLASLSGAGLLIMATPRLAYALVIAGALIWVYVLSTLSVYTGSRFFPRFGKSLIFLFLAYFIGSLYLLLLWFLSPFTALEVFFLVSLVPLFCADSGVSSRTEGLAPGKTAARAFLEAAALGGLLVVFALIREPLGFASLSLPGGSQGIVLLFSFKDSAFFPLRIIVSAAGALLFMGYGFSLYRHFRKIHANGEDEQ